MIQDKFFQFHSHEIGPFSDSADAKTSLTTQIDYELKELRMNVYAFGHITNGVGGGLNSMSAL